MQINNTYNYVNISSLRNNFQKILPQRATVSKDGNHRQKASTIRAAKASQSSGPKIPTIASKTKNPDASVFRPCGCITMAPSTTSQSMCTTSSFHDENLHNKKFTLKR
jgi:hypothetical protein